LKSRSGWEKRKKKRRPFKEIVDVVGLHGKEKAG